jgi:hypothetical protein
MKASPAMGKVYATTAATLPFVRCRRDRAMRSVKSTRMTVYGPHLVCKHLAVPALRYDCTRMIPSTRTAIRNLPTPSLAPVANVETVDFAGRRKLKPEVGLKVPHFSE